MRKLHRRTILTGAAGVAMTLPFLEAFAPRKASAGFDTALPFAVFFRQANGVAAQQNTKVGSEPERFWPTQTGALTAQTVNGRALDELGDYLSRMLVVGNVNMNGYNFGDGHARGAMQGMTARGPTVAGAGGSSEAAGESLDHRIGRELNPDGRDSLFMYAGQPNGWLGGACISYRSSGTRRAPLHNPVNAYMTMMGIDSDLFATLIARQESVNDLVGEQMAGLLANSRLSATDRQRLELHQQSIRDLENSLSCNLADDEVAALEGDSAGYASDNGDQVLAATKVHMSIAALGVACGYTRSVCIQVGSGNDGSTRYTNLDGGGLMENFHFLSHRRQSHDSNGTIIPNSDALHGHVDRHFARTFRYLLDRLDEYTLPGGQSLLDTGVAVWYNDLGTGPGHSRMNVPYIMAGSANGFFKQGEFVELAAANPNHRGLLNTIGSAAGLRTNSGEYITDFGDPDLPTGIANELLA